MSKIGYQHGIHAAKARMFKLDPGGFKPDGTGAWDKFFRTIEHLVSEHDAEFDFPQAPGVPTPKPEPEPSYKKVAPRVAYEQGGSNARFLLYIQGGGGGGLQPGVSQRADGKWTDESKAVYTDLDGREESSVRSPGPAVTGAREMDNRELHDLPLMGDPTKNTGSWAI